jgi:hypothetical protein
MHHGVLSSQIIGDFLRGNAHSLEKYGSLLEQEFLFYLKERKKLYQIEQRWPEIHFWKEMHQLE